MAHVAHNGSINTRDAILKQKEAQMELCKAFFKKLEKLDLLEEVAEESKDDQLPHELQRDSSFISSFTGRSGFPRLMP